MNIAVVGLWHLGLVTAAALAAEGHTVMALDETTVVAGIDDGKLPIDEPGLAELIADMRRAGRLRFGPLESGTPDDAGLVWICYDTPVDDDDRPDVAWVLERTRAVLERCEKPIVVAVSSQLPVGSISELRRLVGNDGLAFACVPENLRLGTAIAYFRAPDRFVVGTDSPQARAVLKEALHFAPAIVWTTIESAEVTKHAINAFLATSVVFANEIASICERVGADARDVERGLKSDVRVGAKAYVRAGEAFAGGTLARDLRFLADLGTRESVALEQLRATAASNDRHRAWTYEQVEAAGGHVAGSLIAILGLVYKPGTDTLRASNAVALARALAARGARVRAYDPAIRPGDARLTGIAELAATAQAALAQADIAIICTGWPEFRSLEPADFSGLRRHVVIDEARFLEERLSAVEGLRYVAFGRPSAIAPVHS
jgi:UDPglucose 6-dehydrogenase